MTDADKGMDPVHFGSDPVDTGIRTNLEIRTRIQSHFWLRQPKFKGLGAVGVGGGILCLGVVWLKCFLTEDCILVR